MKKKSFEKSVREIRLSSIIGHSRFVSRPDTDGTMFCDVILGRLGRDFVIYREYTSRQQHVIYKTVITSSHPEVAFDCYSVDCDGLFDLGFSKESL